MTKLCVQTVSDLVGCIGFDLTNGAFGYLWSWKIAIGIRNLSEDHEDRLCNLRYHLGYVALMSEVQLSVTV